MPHLGRPPRTALHGVLALPALVGAFAACDDGGPSGTSDTQSVGTSSSGGSASTSGASGSGVGASVASVGGAGSAPQPQGGSNSSASGAASSNAGTSAGVAGQATTGSAGESAGGSIGVGGQGAGGAGGGGATAGTGGTGEVARQLATITNGVYWQDTDGNRIEAHGGGFYHEDGTWYWIGEDKAHNAGTFQRVNCYASTNLENWELQNAIITRDTAPELDTSDRIIERPKLTYNAATDRYVMWLHWEGQNYADAEAGVFVSDTVCGDYEYVDDFRPFSNMSRDDTLFLDDDGTAYFISAANENRDLVIYRLTEDFLDVEEQVVTLWPSSWREAPAMFKVDDTYFLVTSGATGWDPNQAQYSYATSIGGPWASLRDLGDSITYDTQSTYVLPIVGSQTTTYVYAGDRWQDPDLASSKYIWLPLKIDGTDVRLDYYEQWQIDVETGEWNAYDEFISQSDWTLVYVDSEETVEEDGAATNAFDDSPSTRWHTGYGDETPTTPHELQIDLGATYLVDAFRHMPRQDVDENGIVAEYEFYVSESTESWGDPVAQGRFSNDENDRTPTLVEFAETRGRYVRFVALEEYLGDAFTSLAELDVRGTLAP